MKLRIVITEYCITNPA